MRTLILFLLIAFLNGCEKNSRNTFQTQTQWSRDIAGHNKWLVDGIKQFPLDASRYPPPADHSDYQTIVGAVCGRGEYLDSHQLFLELITIDGLLARVPLNDCPADQYTKIQENLWVVAVDYDLRTVIIIHKRSNRAADWSNIHLTGILWGVYGQPQDGEENIIRSYRNEVY